MAMNTDFAKKGLSDLPRWAKGVIAVAAVAGAIGIVLWIRKKKKELEELKTVQVNQNNIKHFTRQQLIEFQNTCCVGVKPKTGREAICNQYDVKMVACAWVPKVLDWMDKNNEKKFYMWHPALISKRLFEEMKGVAVGQFITDVAKAAILGPAYYFMSPAETSDYNTREGLFRALSKLNTDQLRWLHNWWVGHHADGDNLYNWVRGEVGVSLALRNAATAAMDRAGVGSDIVYLRNKVA